MDDRKIVKIGGEEVDFTEFPSLLLKHKRQLREVHKVDLRKLGTEGGLSPDEEEKFLLFMVRMVRASTTEEELGELPVVVASQLLAHCMRRSNQVDSPFSTRSTASQPNTDGASAS